MNDTKIQSIKWSHVGICLVVLLVLIFIFRQPLFGQLYSWDLIPKPEPYTELYFTPSNAKTAALDHSYSVSFGLHNVEYQTTDYAYVVDQLDENHDIVIGQLAKGSISLSQDDAKNIDLPVMLTHNNTSVTKVRVTITFLEKNKSTPTSESIYYLAKAGKN